MEITQVRVFPVQEGKLKAFVAVIFDNCFVVGDIKIIAGANGLFVSMPSKRRKDGTFRDIAHPLNNETRRKFERQIIDRYREVVEESGGESTEELRQFGKTDGLTDPGGSPGPEADSSDGDDRTQP